jgi:hypothetical protein
MAGIARPTGSAAGQRPAPRAAEFAQLGRIHKLAARRGNKGGEIALN